MSERKQIVPFSLKDAPALIEKLLPANKLSVEAYKEQMAGSGKTLTALGSYWKGRKPLILNKACILGCLLPATSNIKRDLEIFEKLMAMDDESFVVRFPRRPLIKDILATLHIENIYDYFEVPPGCAVPISSPFNISDYGNIEILWRNDISELARRKIEFKALPKLTYKEMVSESKRPEEVFENVHVHIWEEVNNHFNTNAESFTELVEQIGIMRYGHKPKIGDVFSGSGQIPFEAARLGCDIVASDLNPVSCMLTWGAINIVGGDNVTNNIIKENQTNLIERLKQEIDDLGIESDNTGWRAKAYLYCVEVRCPETGWMVPLIPTLVISKPRTGEKIYVIAELEPNYKDKRYEIKIRSGVSETELIVAEKGTLRSEGRGKDSYLFHVLDGKEYKTKISTIRGDFRKDDGTSGNKLRLWSKTDFHPQAEDIFQERLYCIQWVRTKLKGKGDDYEFRAVTESDLIRENNVIKYVASNLNEWQQNGWVPDMKIETGFNTRQPIWERGWTYWHHLFNPRQLLIGSIINKLSNAELKFSFAQVLNWNSKLSIWGNLDGGGGSVKNTFMNQSLNTIFNYGCRSSYYCEGLLSKTYGNIPLPRNINVLIKNLSAEELDEVCDIFITDPPYGDAVKYEEIMEFFIAWLRKSPPPEFAAWTWDSRRALAIKGEDEGFRRGMVAAYKRMAEKMPDNGIQVIMFTHQSGSIWADMANIVWASGLQVTAAWYVVTETDSALREGSYVKGTILLVLRKRLGAHKTNRSDLAWEIQEEVEEQVNTLTGLNQESKDLYRDENLFSDADVQMAGYAAALRVLTRYSIIDGKDMPTEAVRPRVKGQTTFVDELIEFAVGVANQALVPQGIDKSHWDKLQPAERFYLKMLELEAFGAKTIDNYQNFAKAFKVKNRKPLMASEKANAARLKSSVEFARSEMSGESELANTVLRGVLYGIMELTKDTDADEVLTHISYNVPDYLKNREVVVELSDYLASKLEGIRPDEARSARILRDLARNQKWGG